VGSTVENVFPSGLQQLGYWLAMISQGAVLAGRYQLLAFVTTEDDAELWDGRDTVLDRRVLVRLLRTELAADAGAVQRFSDAARAAGRQATTAGQRVLDFGHDPRRGPFLVLEGAERQPSSPTAPIRTVPRPVQRTPATMSPKVMLALLLIPIAIGAYALRGLIELPSPKIALGNVPLVLPTAAAAQDTPPQPTAAPRSVAPTPAAAPTRAAAPTPTVSPVPGVRKRVVNTDGIGVALRAAPNGERLPGKGYDEGATVTVLEQAGAWTHIRGDDGREGWVLTVTLG
jgi:hypothetical protein